MFQTETTFKLSLFLLLSLVLGVWNQSQVTAADEKGEFEFRVMTWNIWHGGKELGEEVGPKRVARIIRESKADILAMQETYGSGERIAQELGFHFRPRGTNVSILSRFPILEDISIFEEFKLVGAIIQLPNDKKLAFYSIWLPYAEEIWEEGTRPKNDKTKMLAACEPSAKDMESILKLIKQKLSDKEHADLPIVIAGDFNSMSHLDYNAVALKDFEQVIDWPTSQILTKAGFRDSYRELNPQVIRLKDRTWSPRFPKQEQDRIDFVYYKGSSLTALDSDVIDNDAEEFPSDHAAVLTQFRFSSDKNQASTAPLAVVSYNIKHCRGMDNRVDLARTASTLSKLEPDIIGLQEVDLDCKRSGNSNQPLALGERLNMHSAFGRFMDFQGGRYGLAILSKHPIYQVEELRLPEGHEPRVALAATIRLPDNREIIVVNVHFDWVDDDRFRFDQARLVADFVTKQTLPTILLGDFNDEPKSRTLNLFQGKLREAAKPATDRFTFSSTEPSVEIDHIFAHPQNLWRVSSVEVGKEPVTSDHRPLTAKMQLLPSGN